MTSHRPLLPLSSGKHIVPLENTPGVHLYADRLRTPLTLAEALRPGVFDNRSANLPVGYRVLLHGTDGRCMVTVVGVDPDQAVVLEPDVAVRLVAVDEESSEPLRRGPGRPKAA